MPKSRTRKKSIAASTAFKQPAKPNKMVFSKINMAAKNHGAFVEAVNVAAMDSIAKLPIRIKEIQAIFRKATPENIIAAFSFYAGQGSVSAQGEITSFSNDLLQHHTELLQAIMLTVPLSEWGSAPPTPDILQNVMDLMPKITNDYSTSRLIAQNAQNDADHKSVMVLQEMIRLRTQAVRNWGYFAEVTKICRELYAPLDNVFRANLGFTVSDILDVSEALVKSAEIRANSVIAHGVGRKVLRGGRLADSPYGCHHRRFMF